ncbi:MAG TPA: glycoside hydrolase family 1 protein, partial [Clostridiaceae bacterium]|nr:glycoside hydrolase family 1 protein [Clostridiaceae bacterium]
YKFCEAGKIKDKTHCKMADDHWNRYEEDIKLMKNLNHDIYRMSLEWARIEPERGKFCEDALSHYRREIQMLIDNSIKPLVTIHHFSNPIWFEDIGGWANPDSVELFKDYTQKVVTYLGDIVTEWITINEPNVYLLETYITADFPPGKPSLSNFFKGLKNMAKAHIECYKLIHRIRKDMGCSGKTTVGVANHIRVFDVYHNSLAARIPRDLADFCFHTLFTESMVNGRFLFPIGSGGYPYGKGRYSDFFGINYYSRDIIKFSWNPGMMFADLKVAENAEVNDLGWEIYPYGLYRVCRKYWSIYKLPIYITENGICDSKDEKRTKFIYDHLKMIKKLADENVDVKRYYHWSLLDNFEWEKGLTPRFGLIEVDYKTQKRTIRKSGHFFAEVSKNKAVTADMIKRYF